LHLHLEGGARQATINEFAARTGQRWSPPDHYRGFADFQAAYDQMTSFITEPDDLARICREIVADDAGQGAMYTEPVILPSFYESRFDMSEQEIFDLLRDAFFAAGEAFGVEVRLVIAGIFAQPVEATEGDARFAASQSDRGVVAFNFCSTEPGAGYDRWIRSADIARDAGLEVIVHAGEFGPPSAVSAAISVLHADRISHGVRAAEEPDILTQLAESGLVCDIAPTSNVVLGVYREMKEVPIPQFLEAGIPFTINADDPLFSVNGVADDYVVVRDTFGLSDEAMADIACVSVDASNASAATKSRMRAGIKDWLAHPA
jgi:adenosine deaminase